MDIQAYIQSGIIESYVLGLASAEEAAELENLQTQFPEIRQAISDFSASLEQFAFDNAIAPSADVKARILAEVKGETPASVISLPQHNTTVANGSAKRLVLLRTLAAASVIMFIVSAGLNFYLYNQYNQKNNDYQALLAQRNTLQANNQIYQTQLRQWQNTTQVLSDPAMSVIKLPGIAGKEQNLATVYWNTASKEVYLLPNNLPRPVKGKQFQLWALVDGKPVDAGVLDPAGIGISKMKNVLRAQAFAITLEKEGGSVAPTMEEMYVMGKI